MSKCIKKKKIVKSLEWKMVAMVAAILVVSTITLSQVSFVIFEDVIFKGKLKNFEADVKGLSATIENMINKEAVELNKYIYDDDVINFLNLKTDNLKNNDKELLNKKVYLDDILEEEGKNKNIENVYIVNMNGTIVTASDNQAFLTDVSNRDYFKSIKDGKDLYISDIIKSNETGNYINVIARSIKDSNGKTIGVVCKDIISTLFVPIFEKYNYDNFNVALMDTKGNVIYDSSLELIGGLTGVNELDSLAKESFSDVKEVHYSYKNERKVALCGKVENTGWTIFSAATVKAIKAPIKTTSLVVNGLTLLILIITVIIVKYIMKKMIKPIRVITDKLKEIASGDLTVRISDVNTGDEIEELANSLNYTCENLSSILNIVKIATSSVNEQSCNLAAINEETAASNEEIVEAINEISTKICNVAESSVDCKEIVYELDKTVENLKVHNNSMEEQNKEIVVVVEDNRKKIESLIDSKEESLESFESLKTTIRELLNGLSNISEFLVSISSIADQTNLLSLNAAIEAARAGDMGKGFAVVADEIRNLSTQTQEATKNISSIINNINDMAKVTNNNLVSTDEINMKEKDSFKEMEKSFESMITILQTVLQSSKKVQDNINLVYSQNENVTNSILEVTSSAEKIAAITEEVNASINEQAEVFTTINESSEELSTMSEKLTNEIDIFKI